MMHGTKIQLMSLSLSWCLVTAKFQQQPPDPRVRTTRYTRCILCMRRGRRSSRALHKHACMPVPASPPCRKGTGTAAGQTGGATIPIYPPAGAIDLALHDLVQVQRYGPALTCISCTVQTADRLNHIARSVYLQHFMFLISCGFYWT